MSVLPVGKLPPALLAQILAAAPGRDPDVIIGPSPGVDCAVVAVGDTYLVFKSDPITFATSELGWYLVQVNVNDLATTGATPRWLMVTLLLPERESDETLVRKISAEIYKACRALNIAVIGGHTEVTYGLNRPIAVGTLVGVVRPERLIMASGMRAGDRIILTKGIPIEATAILAREFREALADTLSQEEMARAADYLYEPGISVLRDAQTALGAGRVTAMHDPTEGGLAAALWELAEASDKTLVIDLEAIPIPALSAKICAAMGIDPLAAIASGALLMTVARPDVESILGALDEQQIDARLVGYVEEGPAAVWALSNGKRALLERPQRDAIAQLFEEPHIS